MLEFTVGYFAIVRDPFQKSFLLEVTVHDFQMLEVRVHHFEMLEFTVGYFFWFYLNH